MKYAKASSGEEGRPLKVYRVIIPKLQGPLFLFLRYNSITFYEDHPECACGEIEPGSVRC